MRISKDRIEYIALVAEIVGGLGVIISVIYLAIQVGDGNRELRAQNHHDSLALAQRPMEMLIEDGEIAALYVAGRHDDRTLSEIELIRLQYFYFLQFNAWEFSFYQYQDDSIPAELWVGQDGWMREELRSGPLVRRFWRNTQYGFDEPFRSYVNELFTESSDEER